MKLNLIYFNLLMYNFNAQYIFKTLYFDARDSSGSP